jgi:hypothetical protein
MLLADVDFLGTTMFNASLYENSAKVCFEKIESRGSFFKFTLILMISVFSEMHGREQKIGTIL